MNKHRRRIYGEELMIKLKLLRNEWESTEKIKQEENEISRRERLKTIEAEISVLRLMQSQNPATCLSPSQP